MTQENLNKIKKGIENSNLSNHVFNLINMLIKEAEQEQNKTGYCIACGSLTKRKNLKNQFLCLDCSH